MAVRSIFQLDVLDAVSTPLEQNGAAWRRVNRRSSNNGSQAFAAPVSRVIPPISFNRLVRNARNAMRF